MFISKTIVSLVAILAYTSNVVAEPDCNFVEVGFITKPCGNAPTDAELKKFFADQAANVTQLKAQRPCGFTTCPKLKRDLEFTYYPRSLDIDTVKSKGHERSVDDSVALGPNREGRGLDVSEESRPSNSERDFKGSQLYDSEEFERRDLDDLTEDELIERNLPVMRGDDGVLRLYGRGVVPTPLKRDDIDELHDRIKRGEVDSEATSRKREEAPKMEERDWEFDITDEGELIARNLPVSGDDDGNLYLFGSR